ncbi:MAG: CaiB/BaiF CoA-transferase family protein, partial [Pseudomonadota bacterium]
MPGPLSSLKIIEMVGLGPCPLAGQLMADLGAEVIVIDRKSGQDISQDVNRRGKKSIALNLKDPEGVETALKLISGSDIIIEGFRPGVMERLGLGQDTCLSANPRLVYGRMTGWGQDGPLSHSAGHDINYLAITGYLHAMGKDGEPPVPPLNIAADYGGGSMFLLMGVLSAIVERNISGKGQVVDAAMCEGVPAMMGLVQSMFAQGTWTRNREDNFIDGGAPYYRCYKTADDKFISVGAIEPQFFAELIRLLELDETLLASQNNKAEWPAMH